ncbi:MAG TPA: hypothetical protein P5105_01790 [Victivallales bacterium]|nr:hypothetical protein [Victivallales bacterium]
MSNKYWFRNKLFINCIFLLFILLFNNRIFSDLKDILKQEKTVEASSKIKQNPPLAIPELKIQTVGKIQKLHDDETSLDYYQILDKDSRLVFSTKIDPANQNYISVRFKGGDDVRGKLFLRDEYGLDLVYPQNVWFGGLLDEPTHGSKTDGKKAGFFFYSTVSIPLSMTSNNNELKLSICTDNPPSRKIYRIYVHTDPFFSPTEPPFRTITPYKWPKFKPFSSDLLYAIDNKIINLIENVGFRCMNEQLWAPDWKEKVKNKEWPMDMVGGFCIRFDPNKWKNSDEMAKIQMLQKIKDDTQYFYNFRNNLGPLTNPYAGAMAYITKGTKQYKDKVWLERIALALDFTRRAQGANGAFFSPWTKKWVGGPKRQWADGTLEGNAHWAFATAFLLTADDMKKSGLLDQMIDDDCDPTTPPIKRHDAYIDLFSMSAKFLSAREGHAPNQECFQLQGVFPCITALKILNAQKKYYPDMAKMNERIKAITGNVQLGEFSWVSPKGITLESWGTGNGGYTSEYGRSFVTDTWYLYKLSGYEEFKKISSIAADGFIHFVYPVFRDDNKPEWKIDGYLNWRHRMRGGTNFGPSIPAATEFKNPYHIRLLQLEYSGLTISDINNWRGATEGNWFYQSMMGFLREIHERKKLFKNFPANDVLLPMESGAPDFVWGDEIAQVVSFKDGERRVMLCMNQWYKDKKASGYAFIHYLSPEFDTYAIIPHKIPEDKNMFSLNQLCYGDYFIVMNSNLDKKTETVQIPDEWKNNAKKIIDINSGNILDKNYFTINAQETRVYKKITY